MKISELLNIIDGFAPLLSAYDWDNCGLIVGDEGCEITSVLVTLDADMYALEKAKQLGCNTVLSHHPLIFGSLSKVCAPNPAYYYIREGINVISVHTPLDMCEGGVNDTLAKLLNLSDIRPFYDGQMPLGRIGTSSISDPREFADFAKTAIGAKSCTCVLKREVNTVCVIGGSGGSEIMSAYKNGCDTLVTGEAKHDKYTLADDMGINLLVLGHFETENIVLDVLTDKLSVFVPCFKNDRKILTDVI